MANMTAIFFDIVITIILAKEDIIMASKQEARQFVRDWTGKGDEKQDTHRFWIQLLDKVYGDREYDKHILFEQTADKLTGGKDFKDVVINRYTDHTVLIEQKSIKYDLDKPEPRFGKLVTPFEQADHYDFLSSYNDKARWIITCNFHEFWIYDRTRTGKERNVPVQKLKLEDLPEHLSWLQMLVEDSDKKIDFIDEVAVSSKAGELVGVMYDALHKRYKDPDNEVTLKSLNILCVRIVFCLYAEDAGLFNRNNTKIFHDYLAQYPARKTREALKKLFEVLDQKIPDRDPYLADDDPILAQFPYVNGGLFHDDTIEVPPFDDELLDILLNQESMGFDWSKISPTIFGAVFESTLNPQTRRAGGMHYTSITNIHKVIDPLFLDDLKQELDTILEIKQNNRRDTRLTEFQHKLASMKFLDPAAGSGNFLTESYLSLRRLESEIIMARQKGGQMQLDVGEIEVSIQQFYGIEINDFAVSVARTALWIAESQMFAETQEILHSNREFLPLKTFNNIHEGNALRMDWTDILKPEDCSYIMGNPPFVGHQNRSENQMQDMATVFSDFINYGKLDYVAAWYKKAIDYIKFNTKCAFVSTNSLCQGESVAIIWKPLFERGLHIDFAYQSFEWDNEATEKAHVYCVIIGFSKETSSSATLFDGKGKPMHVRNINGYLMPAPNIFIKNRGSTLTKGMPKMSKGSQPTDGGNLLLSKEEKENIITKYPQIDEFIKRYIGANDLINNNERYCLWLKDISPSKYRNIKPIMDRIEKVAAIRKESPTKSVQFAAASPMLFTQIRQPDTDYLAVPETSSQRRKYIPISYLSKDVIASNSLYLIDNANLFIFGVLISEVHMAWMRIVAGRLKEDYRYTPAVYNNFPWPKVNENQRKNIEVAAQQIIEVRNNFRDNSLAILYDPLTMPAELLKAHQRNDKAVMSAYGFKPSMTEPEIVAELMKLYQIKVQSAQ